MNETELESLIVRLVGDSTQYQHMLKDAAEQTKAAADVVQHQGTRMEGVFEALEGVAGKALRVVGMLGIGYGFEQSFEKAEQLELGVIKLNAAIETNHGIVSQVVPQYKEFVKTLMESSTVGKGEAFGLLRRAESYGISGEAAKKAAKDALALAEVTDAGAEGALRIAAAIAQGDVETAQMFRRMIPQLRGAKTEEEFLDKYNRLVATGLKVMGEEAQTAGGKLKQMEHTAAELSVKVGQIVQEAVSPLITQLHSWVEEFNKLDPTVKRVAAQVIVFTAAVGPALYVVKLVSGEVMVLVRGLRLLMSINIAQFFLDSTMRLWNFVEAARASTLAMNAAKLGAVGLAVYGIRELAKELLGGNAAQKQLNDSLKRGAELSDQLRAAHGARMDKDFANAGVLAGEAYVKNIEEQIQATERLVSDKAKLRNRAKEDIDFQEGFHQVARRNFFDAFNEQKDYDDAKRLFDEYSKDISQLEAHLQKLRKAKADTDKALGGNPKVTEDIRGLIADLEKERETMDMSARQAKVFAIAMEGLGGKQADLLDQARQLADELDKAENRRALQQKVDDLTESLHHQADTMGMSAERAQLLSKDFANLTAEQRQALEAAIDYKEGVEEENQLMEKANSLQERANALMEEAASPVEKFAAKLKELDNLRGKGFLNAEQYDRLVGEAAKQLNETAVAAERANGAVKRLDGVLAGSAEAEARVLEFRNLVMEQRNTRTGYQAQVAAQELLIKQGSSNVQSGDPNAKQTDVLKRIEKLLDKYVKKPAVELKPVGAA